MSLGCHVNPPDSRFQSGEALNSVFAFQSGWEDFRGDRMILGHRFSPA